MLPLCYFCGWKMDTIGLLTERRTLTSLFIGSIPVSNNVADGFIFLRYEDSEIGYLVTENDDDICILEIIAPEVNLQEWI